jgi:hypothetical protein
LALPLAACSGDIPLAQDIRNTTVKTITTEKMIFLMVKLGLRLSNKLKIRGKAFQRGGIFQK